MRCWRCLIGCISHGWLVDGGIARFEMFGSEVPSDELAKLEEQGRTALVTDHGMLHTTRVCAINVHWDVLTRCPQLCCCETGLMCAAHLLGAC